MKRKYYMRGLGVGIIATALILMLGLFFSGVPMTDAAVKRRARALGMVDSENASGDASSRTIKELQEEQKKKTGSDAKTTTTTSSDGDVTTTTTKTADPTEKKDDGRDSSTDKTSQANSDDSKSDSKSAKTDSDTTKSESSSKSADNTADSASDKKISITIQGGDTSLSVGKKLQSAGLISSASAFNDYLEQNGYDQIIHTGTYSIKEGSSYREIAKAITGK
ncbi:MAG: hypothetical protein ACI4CS_07920 [Candidatus Weimeria sp.]